MIMVVTKADRGRKGALIDRTRPMSLRSGVRAALAIVPHARRRLGVLLACSVLSGFAEGALMAVLVQMALLLSGSAAAETISLGPLHADLSFRALLILGLVLTALRFSLQSVGAYVPARMSADAQAVLRDATFGSYLNADWPTQTQQREGELQEFLTGHTSRVAQVVLVVGDMLSSILTFAALMASAVLVNPFAAGGSIVAGGLLFIALRPLALVTRRLSTKRAASNLDYAQAVSESVRITQEVVVFGVVDAHRDRASTLSNRASRYQFRTQFIGVLGGIAYQTAAIIIVLAGLGAVHSIGAGEFGTFGAAVLIIVRALSYSQGAQSNYQRLSELVPYVEDVDRQRQKYASRREISGSVPLTGVESIAFEHVSYAYVDGNEVVSDLTFHVNAGEIIGIAGPSGAGKSTLVQLLLRLRRPTSGKLLVNGVDANLLDLDEWRRRVSYVPQEPRLVAGSVAENIAFHRAGITHEAIQEAARLASVDCDIAMMPGKFKALISERDRAVSGGQRQRMCIARALVGVPDVLVLDEPTSALDVQSESAVQQTLASLRGQRTIFVVAHRLSTLRICDRILVMNNGRIEAFATPDGLVDTSAFWNEALELAAAPGARSHDSG